jgi:hypothetical protein
MQADTVMLLKPGAILKTSSGKVRRSACRQAFEQQQLKVVAVDGLSGENYVATASSQAQAWEFSLEAPASRFAKLELRVLGSQSGDWEPVQRYWRPARLGKKTLPYCLCCRCFRSRTRMMRRRYRKTIRSATIVAKRKRCCRY